MFLLLQFKFIFCRVAHSTPLNVTCKNCKFFEEGKKQAFIHCDLCSKHYENSY